ncbi:MAG: hypothetical protein E5Y88_00025 [Mesorhizobium sp.]|uniref:hypothetical protein n=1 Tax=Mesorhizobium sp. TaxID=1871066 RepID=UPI0011F6B719|nr:hypothetical protein [Mesorhizobium sp.]TIL27469.1 MAG: hypothetical protein E5Y88_00025 [Mesorhizobium sp.]
MSSNSRWAPASLLGDWSENYVPDVDVKDCRLLFHSADEILGLSPEDGKGAVHLRTRVPRSDDDVHEFLADLGRRRDAPFLEPLAFRAAHSLPAPMPPDGNVPPGHLSGQDNERRVCADIVEKVRVAATHGICIEWRSSKTVKVNPGSLKSAAVERDSMVGADFAVRRTFSTISAASKRAAFGIDYAAQPIWRQLIGGCPSSSTRSIHSFRQNACELQVKVETAQNGLFPAG